MRSRAPKISCCWVQYSPCITTSTDTPRRRIQQQDPAHAARELNLCCFIRAAAPADRFHVLQGAPGLSLGLTSSWKR